jgi:protein TonB
MIVPPPDSGSHLASAWVTGVALLFLGVGLQGAMKPLAPEVQAAIADLDVGDEIMVEEFDAPASAPEDASEEEVVEELVEEIEIPPLPEITPPLSPPEMAELTPLEPVLEKPAPIAKAPDPKPRTTERKPAPRPRESGTREGGGAPQLFTGAGGGGGRYPSPYYPASARSAGVQGSLRLLVTVEPSGLPSSVVVSSSSGHSVLDSAARDHVQRRWRWPSGQTRRYIVPVRFVLQ